MKITYDKEADAAYIYFKKDKIKKTKEITPDFIVDFNKNGEVVGLEVLSASKNLKDLKKKTTVTIGKKSLELPSLIS